MHPVWDIDARNGSALRTPVEREPMVVAERRAKPLARVAEPDAVAPGGARREAGAVIRDRQPQTIAASLGRHRHAAALRPPADAVGERVLDQRLQDEQRDRRLVERGRDVDPELESLREPQLRDLEVRARVAELVREWHQGLIAMPQKVA